MKETFCFHWSGTKYLRYHVVLVQSFTAKMVRYNEIYREPYYWQDENSAWTFVNDIDVDRTNRSVPNRLVKLSQEQVDHLERSYRNDDTDI
jgi:hypothetical protein